MFDSKNAIEKALERFGRKLVFNDIEPLKLIVCGGSALNVLGLIARATRDVDIVALANVDDQGNVHPSKKTTLPKEVVRIIKEVAIDFQLEPDWLNMGPVSLLEMGLPPGLEKRLISRDYGPCLTVYFISRIDQIHFKLYAMIDGQKGARHWQDLEILKPTENELQSVVRWLLNRRTSIAFRSRVKKIIRGMGYDKIAKNI